MRTDIVPAHIKVVSNHKIQKRKIDFTRCLADDHDVIFEFVVWDFEVERGWALPDTP